MIINLTASELEQAVVEFVCKRGISPDSNFDIKYRAGRKGNPTTATVGINESLVVKQIDPKLPQRLYIPEDEPPVVSVASDAMTEVTEAFEPLLFEDTPEPEVEEEKETQVEVPTSNFKSLFSK